MRYITLEYGTQRMHLTMPKNKTREALCLIALSALKHAFPKESKLPSMIVIESTGPTKRRGAA